MTIQTARSFILAAAAITVFAALSKGDGGEDLATETWVSALNGDDVNACIQSSPCKTFTGAISKTARGGQINVLDRGFYGTIFITKSLRIIAESVEAGVLGNGTNGILINVAASDQVVLEGLDIDGIGTGLNGIQIQGSGKTFIRNCKIRSFTGNGVNLVGTANARVIIENCQILFNGGGLSVQGAGGAANAATIAHSIVDANTSFAVQANGAGNAIGLLADILTGSPVGISALNGATVTSLGAGNLISGSGAPTAAAPFK
jgi:hypothetical protein